MMPLWISATRPLAETCGCALRSVGPPWVAHRVCPMPISLTAIGSAAISASRFEILPAFLRKSMAPSAITATPAES